MNRREFLLVMGLGALGALAAGLPPCARAWEPARDGDWRASLELTADEVKFVGGREDAPRDGASAPRTGAVEPIDTIGDDEVPF
jgi:hypothetical protein